MKDFSTLVPKLCNGHVRPYRQDDDLTNFEIREMDYQETSASTGLTSPHDILTTAVKASDYTWVIYDDDDDIVGIFGVSRYLNREPVGIPWLIGSTRMFNVMTPAQYTRIAKRVIDQFLIQYPVLCNLVLAEYTSAVRWLQLLGFTVDKSNPIILTDKQFYLFYKYDKEG